MHTSAAAPPPSMWLRPARGRVSLPRFAGRLTFAGALALACVLVTSMACAGVAPSPMQSIGQDFTIAVGKSVSIRDTDLVVRFENVTNDSRCPADVQCITVGDATVQIATTTGSAPASRYELHTDAPREVVAGQYRLTLVDLKPLPTSTKPVGASEYVLTLRVSRP